MSRRSSTPGPCNSAEDSSAQSAYHEDSASKDNSAQSATHDDSASETQQVDLRKWQVGLFDCDCMPCFWWFLPGYVIMIGLKSVTGFRIIDCFVRYSMYLVMPLFLLQVFHHFTYPFFGVWPALVLIGYYNLRITFWYKRAYNIDEGHLLTIVKGLLCACCFLNQIRLHEHLVGPPVAVLLRLQGNTKRKVIEGKRRRPSNATSAQKTLLQISIALLALWAFWFLGSGPFCSRFKCGRNYVNVNPDIIEFHFTIVQEWQDFSQFHFTKRLREWFESGWLWKKSRLLLEKREHSLRVRERHAAVCCKPKAPCTPNFKCEEVKEGYVNRADGYISQNLCAAQVCDNTIDFEVCCKRKGWLPR